MRGIAFLLRVIFNRCLNYVRKHLFDEKNILPLLVDQLSDFNNYFERA